MPSSHEGVDGLVIDRIASVLKFFPDSAVAVPSFVLFVNLPDLHFDSLVLVLCPELSEMVIKCAPGHPGML